MPYVASHCLAVLLIALLAGGCAGSDDDGGSTPPPAASPTPTPPPPSGVASVAGNWNGTSDFQQSGVRFISNTRATLTQNDRTVQGSVTFTSPGWEGWRGTVLGTVAGTAPDTQFIGNVTVQSNSTTGTGICTGDVTMVGPSISTFMRWEAPTLTISSNVPTQPPNACRGTVFTVVWIFNR